MKVERPGVRGLSYAQLHEYIRMRAIGMGLDFYFFLHSDAVLGRGVVSEALRGICALHLAAKTRITSSTSSTTTNNSVVSPGGAQIPATVRISDNAKQGRQSTSTVGVGDWGVLLYNWDIFCAFSTRAVAAVGAFDPYVPPRPFCPT